jgi:hypothetical protein
MKSYFFAAVFLISGLICQGQVTIMVNRGSFSTVQEASAGEDLVNFFDADMSDDRACTECFAAMELVNFLPYATNLKKEDFRFVQPGQLPQQGNVFIIGSRHSNSAIGKYNPAEARQLDTEQSYLVRSYADNQRVITIIEGADRIGALYGVYACLQFLGIKFIGLGEKGTVYPEVRSDIAPGIDLTGNPSFLSRGFYTWGDRKADKSFFLWMARNRFNYWTVQNQPYNFLKKLGVKLSDGGHRVQGIVFNGDDEYPYDHPLFKGDENKPKDPYKPGNEYAGDTNKDGKLSLFEAHPEWYGLKNGKRMKIVRSDDAAQHDINFCTSNPDARREFARRVVEQLTDGEWKHVDVFEFWMFDGGANLWCSCDNCKSAGSYSDKMLLVTNDILKELEKMRNSGKLLRRIEVSCIAYHATLEPPSRPLPPDFDYANSSVTFFPIGRCYAHSFADPACTEINQWQLKAYQGWTMGEQRYYKGPMFIGEYYNVSSLKTLPVVFPKIMSVDIPWYYMTGARQFHYMHTPDTLWGTWTLNQYLLGNLLWNVRSDANAIIDDFFRSYYPTTAGSSRKFYEQLEKASANIKVFKHYVETGNGRNYSLSGRLLKGDPFELDHMHLNEYHPLLNDGTDVEEMMDAMELAGKYLDVSLINCKNRIEQQRLLEDKHRFDYGYAMYRYIYHMIRTSVFHKNGDKAMAAREFANVVQYAGELRNMVDVVQSSSEHANAANGFEATGSAKVYDEFMRLYGK